MTISEKVAFLRGLIEGSELQLEPKQQKILDLMMEILADVSLSLTDLNEGYEDLQDDVEELHEESDEVYDRLDDILDILHGFSHALRDDDDDDDDDVDYYECECPNCGHIVSVDELTLFDMEGIPCPRCGNRIPVGFPDLFDFGDDDDEDDDEDLPFGEHIHSVKGDRTHEELPDSKKKDKKDIKDKKK